MQREAENNKEAAAAFSRTDDKRASQPVVSPVHREIAPTYDRLADNLFELLHNEEKDRQNKSKAVPAEIADGLKGFGAGSLLLGVLSKCMIVGCDVHKLTYPDFDIVEHYSEDMPVPEEFRQAREKITSLPQTVIAVLVYNDHLEFLQVDGTLFQ